MAIKICKILIAKSLVFLGKVEETLLFYLKKKGFLISILNAINYNLRVRAGRQGEVSSSLYEPPLKNVSSIFGEGGRGKHDRAYIRT
ncbi:MAG: hypothetical protein A2007_05050 [Verrucomicrobia bacterium GWC2_42_7]|nr:MAG: hypothetical protein A2007_05050 [Verrucomicrobia bacterium GWC2_42_7]